MGIDLDTSILQLFTMQNFLFIKGCPFSFLAQAEISSTRKKN